MFERLKSWLKSTPTGSKFLSGAVDSWFHPVGNTEALLESYDTSPWLRATAGRVARSASQTVWRVYKAQSGDTSVPAGNQLKRLANMGRGEFGRGTRSKALDQVIENNQAIEDVNHPILMLLQDPNPVLTAMQIFITTVAGINTSGEYGWWIVRGKRSRIPLEIWPIPPHWIQRLPTESNPTYHVQHNRFDKEIPKEDFILFKDPSIVNPYGKGSGVGGALGYSVDIDKYASKHILQFFLNGGLPDVLIGIDGATEPDLLKAKTNFLASHSGSNSIASKVHFHSGGVDVKAIQSTNKEAQTLEIRAAARNEIMQVQGHPPEIHGVLENSNRSTIDSAYYLFAMGVLLPILQLMAQTIQKFLMPMFPGGELFAFSFDSPVPEDKEFQLQVLTMAPDAFTVDEIRGMAGFPPLQPEQKAQLYVPVTYSSKLDGEGDGGSDSSPKDTKPKEPKKALLDFQADEFMDVPTRTH